MHGSFHGYFFVYGSSFDDCLSSLAKFLQRCIDSSMVLNYEKCHFMIKFGIVLEHVISGNEIEIDPAKIEIIFALP